MVLIASRPMSLRTGGGEERVVSLIEKSFSVAGVAS
jgi:hypothetical protein